MTRLIDADALNLLIEANQLLNPKLSVYDVQKIIEGMPTVNLHTEKENDIRTHNIYRTSKH
jgi:hypothetical protein